jgi:geranylgeranyl diphosphate synthase type II
MGKASGSDERLGKRTYVSVFGLEEARELARESHGKARAALADAERHLPGSSGDLERMTDFMYARHT